MFMMKLLGKIIALPMILVLTILFYVVTILSRIYGLAAIAFNLAIMLCAIIALVLQQWNNFGIAVAILVISYLIMGAFGTERLDQLASRFRELECKSDRFLFSDRDEENTTEQNALRTGMKQKEIFYNVHKLLDKAQIPVSYQIESFKRMIDNSKFDMELKIDIMEYRTRVFCYERGTLVFEKYVDDRTLLEYLILNEVVCSVCAGRSEYRL